MPSWSSVSTTARELAELVQDRFDASGLGFLATLRRDGFPRISGIEPLFTDEVWLGMMPGSRKALDLRRDPRLALHNASVDREVKDGDARITGLGIEVTDEAMIDRLRADFEHHTGQAPPPGPMHLFRVDVRELTVVRPEGGRLVIRSWSEARGVQQVERT